MAVGTTVKIDGDGDGAVSEFRRVANAANSLGDSMKSFGRDAAAMGAGVLGAEAIAQGFQAAVQGVTSAVQAYAATNQGAADTLAGLSAQMTGVMESIGGAIFESQAFQEALGQVSRAMSFLESNAESIANVVGVVLRFAIDAVIVAIDSWNGAVAGIQTAIVLGEAAIDGMATATVNLSLQFSNAVTAVYDFGLALSQGVLGVVDDVVLGLRSMVESLARVGSLVGLDLSGVTEALDGWRGGIASTVEGLDELRASAAAVAAERRALQAENNDANSARDAERAERLVEIERRLQDQLTETGSSQAYLTDELRLSGTAMQAVSSDAEEATNSLAFLGQQAQVVMGFLTNLGSAFAKEMETVDELTTNRGLKAAASIQAAKTELELFEALMAEKEADEKARSDAANAERADARQTAAQETASGIAAEFGAVVSGQKTALQAIKDFTGQMLIAKGSAYGLEAAAMFFVPGMQANAAGLAAAAAAMVAAGSLLSAAGGGGGGSAGGAGVAPVGGAAPQQVSNTNTTVNVGFSGIIGDMASTARSLGQVYRAAVDLGEIR